MPNVEHELTKFSQQQFTLLNFTSTTVTCICHSTGRRKSFRSSSHQIKFFPYSCLHRTTCAVMLLLFTVWVSLSLTWAQSSFSRCTESILDNMQTAQLLFVSCKSFNRNLHPSMCVLYGKVIGWCVCLMLSDGTRFDHSRTDAFNNMELPTTLFQVQQQCFGSLQWMRSANPHFPDPFVYLLISLNWSFEGGNAHQDLRRSFKSARFALWIDPDRPSKSV